MDRSDGVLVAPRATGKIGAAEPRARVVVTGIVVRVEPVRWVGGPVLEVQLRDETGVLGLAFLGRRAIGGVVPGALMTVAGTVGRHHGRTVILNPELWLRKGPRPAPAGSVDMQAMSTRSSNG